MSVDIAQLTVVVTIVWVILGFFCGSLAWSHWIEGRDGASRPVKGVSYLLDALMGALPVIFAKYVLILSGVPLVIVALSPIFGHAFSPWLRFKGDNALAVAAGVYVTLTVWQVMIFGVILLIVWMAVVKRPGWAATLMGVCLIIVLLILDRDPVLLAMLTVNLLVIAWASRGDLVHAPGLRGWIGNRLPAGR
ncbi:MAG TPA: glycerol-3-phosphate acyltransferase [Phototrophicaceae bacterium]|nr:glycerol-3-phosphate acyltransferase [Phototrophicaceae bacterium]